MTHIRHLDFGFSDAENYNQKGLGRYSRAPMSAFRHGMGCATRGLGNQMQLAGRE